jgi:hypothetical protein
MLSGGKGDWRLSPIGSVAYLSKNATRFFYQMTANLCFTPRIPKIDSLFEHQTASLPVSQLQKSHASVARAFKEFVYNAGFA